jgi:hypothetical protein
VKCHNNQTCECVFRLEVALSVSFSDQDTLNAHESDMLCDHVLGTEMHVSGDRRILFENRAKYGIILKKYT